VPKAYGGCHKENDTRRYAYNDYEALQYMKKIILRSIIMLAIIIAAGVFIVTLVHATFFAPESIAVPAAQSGKTPELYSVASSSLPSRLIIPSLGINANIQYVGVNAQGNMRAPDNFTDVSWYQYGTVPGMIGSAVMAGHVDNGLGLDGVFKHLTDLKVDDDVYIQTIGGTRLHFKVSDIEVYPYQSVPTTTLFAQHDAARLNLITCDGSWVSGGDTYDHRIVIYTREVKS
jgi:LPXTG-site transpeptidase (sortase) family protein